MNGHRLLQAGIPFAATAILMFAGSACLAQRGGGGHGGGGGGHGGGGFGGGGGHAGGSFGGGHPSAMSSGAFHNGWSGGNANWHAANGNWNGNVRNGNWNGNNWHNGNWNGNWRNGNWNNRWGWGWGGWWGWGPGWGWGWWPGSGWGFGSGAYADASPSYADPVYPFPYYNEPRMSAYMDPNDYSQQGPPPNPNAAHIRVLVPENAKVWFNQGDTTQTGPVRIFDTPALEPGKSYSYEVRAQWLANGQEVNQKKQVFFHSGDAVTVSFLGARSLPAPRLNPPLQGDREY